MTAPLSPTIIDDAIAAEIFDVCPPSAPAEPRHISQQLNKIAGIVAAIRAEAAREMQEEIELLKATQRTPGTVARCEACLKFILHSNPSLSAAHCSRHVCPIRALKVTP